MGVDNRTPRREPPLIVESVTVRRFRAVEEATLHLGGVTYLVGRNGAGKSTFLNAFT